MTNAEETNVTTDWSPSIVKAACASLLGGLLAFGIMEPLVTASQTFDAFFAYPELPELGVSASDETVDKFTRAYKDFYGINYAAGFATIGACIGICFVGLTVPTRKIPSAALAATLGAIGAGIAAYFAGTTTGVEMFWGKDQSLTKAAAISFGIWAAMSVGIVSGASIVQGGAAILVKSIVAALIASVFVVIANILVASIVFPSANSSDYIPIYLAERSVWIVVVSLAFGAAMSLGLKPSQKPAQVPETPATDA